MISNLREQATYLANRPYTTVVFLDQSTDGESIYVALNPELEGCVSQGDTLNEALHNLNEARVDFIYFLLKDGLEVPAPRFLSGHRPFVLSMPIQEDEVYDNKPDYLWTPLV